MSEAWTVYRLTCQASAKSYIGITRLHPTKRWAQHQVHALRENRQSAIGAAIRKYGPEAFAREVLCEAANEEEAVVLERVFIAAFETMVPAGYNLTSGGEYRKVLSEESRAKIGRANSGRKWSEERRARMSALQKGKKRPFSQEHLERLRAASRSPKRREAALARWAKIPKVVKPKLGYHTEARKRSQRINQPIATAAAAIANRGRKRSPEFIAKLVAFHTGRKRSAETRARISAARRNRAKANPIP